MSNPLAGATAKIERAEQQIHYLNGEITAFLQQQSSLYDVIGELRNEGMRYSFFLSVDYEIPIRFSIICGEIVHNLRSSLDHLAYALVQKGDGTPTTQTQFPICSTAEKYLEACKRGRIKGVSATAEKLIESVQPYKGSEPGNDILAVLDVLNIHDKHKLLVVIAAAAQIGTEIRMNPGHPTTVAGLSPPSRKKVDKNPTEIFFIDFAEPVTEFSAEADFVVQIAFEEVGEIGSAPVIDILVALVHRTKAVLELFRSEFA